MAHRISPGDTLMFQEASESPAVVSRQRSSNRETVRVLGQRLRARAPRAVITLARGSSDHAATFARYIIERHAGVLTSSLSPSIASLYESTPDLKDMVVLAISQSGRSPDLVAAAEQTRAKGAFLVSLVNDEHSPLASLADVTIPLLAGPERSVAASKSFIAALAASLDLLASWTNSPAITAALDSLPEKLAQAWKLDWNKAVPALSSGQSIYTVGRGHGLAIAQEAALKLKETCAIHAEAFSAAEVRHGPMALVGPGFPVLLFGQADEGLQSVREVAVDIVAKGAAVMSAGVPGTGATELPVIAADPLIAPLLEIASFYRLANALAVATGRNPDRPPHLAKVTETV